MAFSWDLLTLVSLEMLIERQRVEKGKSEHYWRSLIECKHECLSVYTWVERKSNMKNDWWGPFDVYSLVCYFTFLVRSFSFFLSSHFYYCIVCSRLLVLGFSHCTFHFLVCILGQSLVIFFF